MGEYGDLSRRLVRLGHIAFFGLGILSLILARELPELALDRAAKTWASRLMVFGNVFLPLTLFAAGVFEPLKYLMPLPAMAVFAAMALAARGSLTRPAAVPSGEQKES